ncbi:MAG: NADH-quinone oxidoreductase subunit NuoE [Clostridiales bacterium]|jgi:NADH-quinone oxidoreductase subunit E|nr:NADH-quinone oxidoreductase subunit NuoE [Clostridiales bacterium]
MDNKNIGDLSKLEQVFERYSQSGHMSGQLIVILQEAQNIYGYLPEDVIECIADRTGIKPAKIMGVATFYTQFRLKPVGKYLIMVCQGTACHVNESGQIEQALEEELGIGEGETTADGLFTLKNVACLGCCSLSPVMMINGDTYGNLTPDKVKEIINKLR